MSGKHVPRYKIYVAPSCGKGYDPTVKELYAVQVASAGALFQCNRGRLERQGVDVNEWNQASKGMTLPKRAKPKASGRRKARGR